MYSLALAATFGVGALAQVTGLLTQIEPADFNITQALLDRDVDVTKLSLVDVSQESACAAAVSTIRCFSRTQYGQVANNSSVKRYTAYIATMLSCPVTRNTAHSRAATGLRNKPSLNPNASLGHQPRTLSRMRF